jgi:chromate transporter
VKLTVPTRPTPTPQIIFGVMPFWGRFRNWSVYKRALPGFNAAGVGLIITSVFTLTFGAMQASWGRARFFWLPFPTHLRQTHAVILTRPPSHPPAQTSPFPAASLCLGIVAFTAVDQLKLFEPAVVVAGGVLGIVGWALKMK